MQRSLIHSAILLCLVSTFTAAQVENQTSGPLDLPNFYVDIVTFLAHDSTARADIYVQIPYSNLHFLASDSTFEAQYEVSVDVFSDSDEPVVERVWDELVQSRRFEQTQDTHAASLTQRSVTLLPGKYHFRLQVRDLESRKTVVADRQLLIPNYSAGLMSVSDIMLVNQVTREGERNSIAPNVSGNLAELLHGFHLFFELYDRQFPDTARLRYLVKDQKGEVVYSSSERVTITGPRSQVIARIDSSRFPSGMYTVGIDVSVGADSGKPGHFEIIKSRPFTVHWVGVPLTEADLDLAIRQLRYIASEKEYEELTDAKSFTERQQLFVEFWKRRDPAHTSGRGTSMQEYYSRVEYANHHFSHYLEGWRTDMGMVYIIFGPPNNVDRHPFDYDSKPYEIWSYYDLNRQLVFLDDTGFGDYRLITPIWDLLNRIR